MNGWKIWKKISTGTLVLGLLGGGVIVKDYVSGDCCATGGWCCALGLSCCHGGGKTAQR